MYCSNKTSDTQQVGRSFTHLHILYEILVTSAIKRLVTVKVFEVMSINLNTDNICT